MSGINQTFIVSNGIIILTTVALGFVMRAVVEFSALLKHKVDDMDAKYQSELDRIEEMHAQTACRLADEFDVKYAVLKHEFANQMDAICVDLCNKLDLVAELTTKDTREMSESVNENLETKTQTITAAFQTLRAEMADKLEHTAADRQNNVKLAENDDILAANISSVRAEVLDKIEAATESVSKTILAHVVTNHNLTKNKLVAFAARVARLELPNYVLIGKACLPPTFVTPFFMNTNTEMFCATQITPRPPTDTTSILYLDTLKHFRKLKYVDFIDMDHMNVHINGVSILTIFADEITLPAWLETNMPALTVIATYLRDEVHVTNIALSNKPCIFV